jgi:spermidine/putrescine transport system substrate-binding protein
MISRLSTRTGNLDALLARVAADRVSRRQFLRRMGGAGAFILAGPTVLAACGDGGGGEGGGGGGDGEGGALVVDNWIQYIDLDENDEFSPTLLKFEEATGLTVDYREGVNSNEEWFGKYQPQLAAGEPTGIDVVVLTDYMAARMIRLDYVETIDKANVPNASNLVEKLQTIDYDPNRDFTLPWQSGFTGLAYDADQTGRELTKLTDLLDPAFAGRVGILRGYNDTLPLFMLMKGVNPTTASVDDYVAATADIKAAIDSGQIRQVYGNDYLDELLNGNLAVALGWSGDIVANQEDNPQLRFAFPEEGFMLWNDNMMIPKGAANKLGAEQWMNHYYDPAIAAELAAWVWYVSPVEGAKEAVADIDPALADEPLIFPTPELLANSYSVRSFTEEEEATVNEAVAAATGV